MITGGYRIIRIMLAKTLNIWYKNFMAEHTSKYDDLIHLACEHKQKASEVFKQAKKLFPALCRNPEKHIYEEFFSETKIEMFAYSRSMGMSVKDSAHSIDLSSLLVDKALRGEGVSVNTLIKLAKSELTTKAEIKYKHLKNLESSEEKGSSLTFLQTVYPKEYRKDALLSNVTVNNFSDDPEKLLKEKGIPIPDCMIKDVEENVS
jgi:hypothetical protein